MPETSERVTVRIPQDLLDKLKHVQKQTGTGTISDTIREGLERFVEMYLPPPNVRKVIVELSRQDNRELEAFVRDGNSVSVDDAVRSAVRDYIRQRVDHGPEGSRIPRADPHVGATESGGSP